MYMDGSRVGKDGKILYKKGRYYGNQDFGSSLPRPNRGRDKVRASRLSNTIKDESKKWVWKKR